MNKIAIATICLFSLAGLAATTTQPTTTSQPTSNIAIHINGIDNIQLGTKRTDVPHFVQTGDGLIIAGVAMDYCKRNKFVDNVPVASGYYYFTNDTLSSITIILDANTYNTAKTYLINILGQPTGKAWCGGVSWTQTPYRVRLEDHKSAIMIIIEIIP